MNRANFNTMNPLSADNQPPPAKRKRLNDDTSTFACSSSSSTHLEPNLWAQILDFLPYESLLQTSLVSRSMLHEAMPLVTMLHINNSSQLYAGNIANRYRDVRDIYIYSLLKFPDDDDGISIENVDCVDDDTATRVVPFLCHFPKLERVFVGGLHPHNGRVVTNGSIRGRDSIFDTHTTGDTELISNLINAFSGAFKAGALNDKLWVLGLKCPQSTHHFNLFRDDMNQCKTCINACMSFPLDAVVNHFECEGSSSYGTWLGDESLNGFDACLTIDQIEDIIINKRGGRELLYGKSRILALLGNGTRLIVVTDDDEELYVVQYNEVEMGRISRFIEKSNININTLSSNEVTEAIKCSFAADERDMIPPKPQCYLAEDSFSQLKDLGLPIDETDFLNEDEWDGIRKRNLWSYNWRFS